MIQLTRVRTAAAIPAEFRGEKRVARELKLFQQRRQWLKDGGSDAGSFELNSNLWKPAKLQLAREAGDKCAYCEASAKTVCHCDVEHVRPKAIYWWLALCYDNYLLACQLCNQVYKGDKYEIKGKRLSEPAIKAQSSDAGLNKLVGSAAPDPLDDSQTTKRSAYAAAFRKEKPALVNPYLDQPEDLFRWEPDADQSQVWMRPRQASGAKHWRADRSIEMLGLNREELRRVRWQAYRPIATHCRILQRGLLDSDPALKAETEAMLVAAMAPAQYFAGLCRWTIREQFGLPL